jgi:hypothetical protein
MSAHKSLSINDDEDWVVSPFLKESAQARDRLVVAAGTLIPGEHPWVSIDAVLGSRWATALASEAAALESASIEQNSYIHVGTQIAEHQ